MGDLALSIAALCSVEKLTSAIVEVTKADNLLNAESISSSGEKLIETIECCDDADCEVSLGRVGNSTTK